MIHIKSIQCPHLVGLVVTNSDNRWSIYGAADKAAEIHDSLGPGGRISTSSRGSESRSIDRLYPNGIIYP